MTLYDKTVVGCKKVIKKTEDGVGNYYFTIDFVYTVQKTIFGKVKVYTETKQDKIRFYSLDAVNEYLEQVIKESEIVTIKIGYDREDHILVYPKDMPKIHKYYGSDTYIVYFANNYEFVQDHLYSASDKTLGGLTSKLIKTAEKTTTVVSVIQNEEPYMSLPDSEKMERLKLERNDVIKKELERVHQYESFLKTLIK